MLGLGGLPKSGPTLSLLLYPPARRYRQQGTSQIIWMGAVEGTYCFGRATIGFSSLCNLRAVHGQSRPESLLGHYNTLLL